MKVTLEWDGQLISLNTPSGFKLLVDDRLILEHEGEVRKESHKCYGSCHGTSSLFNEETYINFTVPNSSFIEKIRWWAEEETLGTNSLEVAFHNGTFAAYSEVPLSKVKQWIAEIKGGSSAGRWYNDNIKRVYECITEGDSNGW
jgi:hypothetical protein